MFDEIQMINFPKGKYLSRSESYDPFRKKYKELSKRFSPSVKCLLDRAVECSSTQVCKMGSTKGSSPFGEVSVW